MLRKNRRCIFIITDALYRALVVIQEGERKRELQVTIPRIYPGIQNIRTLREKSA